MQEQELRAPSAGEPTVETGMYDRRLVEHDEIVGAQHAVEIAKEAMALGPAL